mmetsp:Transcript_117041/g.342816  ORF Transcript_117041/g.342816 Transcript_117041/m.342816 type:complete len:83 (+) Transcript_117041:217-465(+)
MLPHEGPGSDAVEERKGPGAGFDLSSKDEEVRFSIFLSPLSPGASAGGQLRERSASPWAIALRRLAGGDQWPARCVCLYHVP